MVTTPLAFSLATPPAPSCPAAPAPAQSTGSLYAALASVPDHRQRRGLRHPLPALLAQVTCALLCGQCHPQAIADWGRNHSPALMAALGFTRPTTPCVATFHNVLAALDWEALEAALRQWAHALLAQLEEGAAAPPADTLPPEAAWAARALAVDGKTLRGALKMSAQVSQLVSVLGHRLGLTVGAAVVEQGDEIAAVEAVLTSVVLAGKVVTVDALHTQRDTAKLIGACGGDYLMPVKGNQPQLQEAVLALFAPEHAADQDRQSAATESRGHGRLESRWLLAISLPAGTLDWPGAQQAWVIERQVWHPKRKERHREVVYGLTSLSRERAGPAVLLRLLQGHWGIENRSHWVRDVTLGEDASLVRTGPAPQVLALLRTAAISRLRAEGAGNIAAETRRLMAQPEDCLRLLGLRGDN